MKRKLLGVIALTSVLALGTTIVVSCNDNTSDINQDKQIVIEGSSGTIQIGSQVTLKAMIGEQELKDVKRSSSNSTVLVIDSAQGIVTPVKVGTAEISASKDGYTTGKISLTVRDPSLRELSIEATKTKLKVGEDTTLTATDSGEVISDVTWESANASIATITSKGVLTARKVGTVRITASKTGFNQGFIDIVVEAGDPEPLSYQIVFNQTTGVEFSSEKTKAKAGEIVEFTATTTNSIIEIKSITMNGTPLNEGTNGKYSFTMPNGDAIIKATVDIPNADVVVSGEQAIPLVENEKTGIYEAKGIVLNQKSQLSYLVKGENGEVKELSYQDFDFYKCFADIETPKDYHEYNFQLPGGFTYDFYYNPNADVRPAYIIRTAVNDPLAINNNSAFESLFDGGKSQATTYPQNVSKVTYTNTVTEEKYEFNRYKNNTSIAKVTDDIDVAQEKALVYKKLDGDNYQYVDTYIEGKNDPTRQDDTDARSGNVKVVDTYQEMVDSQWKSWPRSRDGVITTTREAEFDSTHYSHDMNSIEFDIMYAYRTGYAADELQSYKIDISTVSNSDEAKTFTTTIDSRKTLADESSSLYEHYEYDVVIKFNKDGSINTGKYTEKVYGQDAYNFTEGDEGFKPGGEEIPTSTKEITFKYEYAQESELSEAPSLDVSKYFVSSIDSLRINNDNVNTDTSKNVLAKEDSIEKDSSKPTLKMTYSPETALDVWQYDVITSTDESVIGPGNATYIYKAKSPGTSTVTIGNRSTNSVTKSVNVTVEAKKVRGLYFMYSYGSVTEGVAYPDDLEYCTADKVSIYGGTTARVTLKASPDGADNYNFTFEVQDSANNASDDIKVSYDPNIEVLTINAEDINPDAMTPYKLKVTSPNWEDGMTGYKILTINVLKGSNLTIDNMVGTYTARPQSEQDSTVGSVSGHTFTLTKTTSLIDEEEWYVGSLTNGTITRQFYWGLNDYNMPVWKLDIDTDQMYMTYNIDTGYIGIYYATGSWEGLDTVETTVIFGQEGGDEDFFTPIYEWFSK